MFDVEAAGGDVYVVLGEAPPTTGPSTPVPPRAEASPPAEPTDGLPSLPVEKITRKEVVDPPEGDWRSTVAIVAGAVALGIGLLGVGVGWWIGHRGEAPARDAEPQVAPAPVVAAAKEFDRVANPPQVPQPEIAAQPIGAHKKAPGVGKPSTDAKASGVTDPPVSDSPMDLETASRSVARIVGEQSTGTGFMVAPGVLATNAHVLANEYIPYLRLEFPGGTSTARTPGGPAGVTSPGRGRSMGGDRSGIPTGTLEHHRFGAMAAVAPARPRSNVELLYEDLDRDLALLRVEQHVAPLQLAPDDTFRVGSPIRIIGNPPIGGLNHVMAGTLSTRTEVDGQLFDQISASVNPGDSGGPILDIEHRVLGMTTLKAGGLEGIAFGIPVRELRAALERVSEVSQQRAAALTRDHDWRIACKNLTVAGLLYSQALDDHEMNLGAAKLHDRDPEATLRGVRAEWDRRFEEIGLRNLAEEEEVLRDTGGSERTRRDLGEMLDLVQRMHALWNEDSRGQGSMGNRMAGAMITRAMSAADAQELQQARGRLEELARNLAIEFGMEEPQFPVDRPPLELLTLRRKYERVSRRYTITGEVRNVSAEVFNDVVANIIVLDPHSGQGHVLGNKGLVPQSLPPGERAAFLANLSGILDPGLPVIVVFSDREGQILRYRRRDAD